MRGNCVGVATSFAATACRDGTSAYLARAPVDHAWFSGTDRTVVSFGSTENVICRFS